MGKAEQQFEHLTDAQIEHYGDRTSGEGPNQNGLEIDQAIETHLAACDGCRIRVLEFHRSRFGLMSDPSSSAPTYSGPNSQGSPDSSRSAQSGSLSPANLDLLYLGRSDEHRPTPDCPTADALQNLAAGLSSADAPRLTQHAAQCPHCGPILRAYTEDFSDDLSPEDQALLSQLKSSTPEWQKKMAQQMAAAASDRATLAENARVAQPPSAVFGSPSTKEARVVQPEPGSTDSPVLAGRGGEPPSAVHGSAQEGRQRALFGRPSLKWILAPVALAATAVIAFFIWNAQRATPEKVEKLLAQAYTEQRTIEMRFPGASNAPMRIERGDSRSTLSRPTALLDAELKISQALQKQPNNAEWLDKKGRAELLDGDYASAISTLQQAKELASTPAVLSDLATAYFQRASAEDHVPDYGNSVECLTAALNQSPRDPILLFNRAIAYEHLFLYHEALYDWEQFLKVSDDGAWNREAWAHLQQLKEKLSRGKLYHPPPLSLPDFSRSMLTNNRNTWIIADIDIENYLQEAIDKWLPIAFLDTSSEYDRANAQRALDTLSAVLTSRHSDTWLRDMLQASRSSESGSAIAMLAAARRAELASDLEGAVTKARSAERLFRTADNRPGAQEARAELIYTLHRTVRATECAREADSLSKEIERTSYLWLRGYVLIETSVCAGMTEQLDSSRAAIDSALALIKPSSYPELYMRALGIAASLDSEVGLPDSAWAKDMIGLKLFWAGSYAPVRAYQFYSDLGFLPEKSKQWFLALALAREATVFAGSTGNPLVEALAYRRRANCAILANDNQDATKSFQVAQTRFRALPDTEAIRAYILEGKISLAELQMKQRAFESAFHELETVRGEVNDISDYAIPLRLYEVLGNGYLQQGRLTEARTAFARAIEVSEGALDSLHTQATRLRWQSETKPAYKGLLDTYLRQDPNSLDALPFWERYRASSMRGAATTPVARGVTRNLAVAKSRTLFERSRSSLKNEIVLSYVQLEDRLLIFVFDDRAIHSRIVHVSQAEFERVATQFVSECSTPQSNIETLRRHGRLLYDWLISPVMSYLSVEREILIESDDDTANIPFPALVDPEGKYLMATFIISMSPGIYYRDSRSHFVPSRNLDVAVVAGPAFEGRRFAPLPAAVVEAETVSTMFTRSRTIKGKAATAQAVQQALVSAEIFHFAGHASVISGNSGLVVAGHDNRSQRETSGFSVFNSARVAHLRLRRSQLVVLSACSTALRPDQVLTDPDELVEALFIAGAPRIVASRWNVDSASTAQIMSTFYETLMHSASYSRSLQLAQREVSNKPEVSHPYFWASFYCYGRS